MREDETDFSLDTITAIFLVCGVLGVFEATELPRQRSLKNRESLLIQNMEEKMVGRVGFEPTTSRLKAPVTVQIRARIRIST